MATYVNLFLCETFAGISGQEIEQIWQEIIEVQRFQRSKQYLDDVVVDSDTWQNLITTRFRSCRNPTKSSISRKPQRRRRKRGKTKSLRKILIRVRRGRANSRPTLGMAIIVIPGYR